MLQQISKKTLFLFLVFTTLTQFGSTKSMETKSALIDLPTDCLGEIFQFVDNDMKSYCTLRLVCKKFKQSARQRPIALTIKKNETIEFPKDLNLIGKVTSLTINCCDLPKVGNLEHLVKLSVGYGKKITGLEKLKKLQNLEVENYEDFDLKGSENLTILRSLIVRSCANFNANLQHLESLQILTIEGCDTFTGDGMGNLTNLRELAVMNCKNFTEQGLENLKGLRELTVIFCDRFQIYDCTIEKLRKQKCKVSIITSWSL